MPSKLPNFSYRTEPNTLKKIKYIAEYSGRTTNKEIDQLVKAHINQFEQDHGEIQLHDDEE